MFSSHLEDGRPGSGRGQTARAFADTGACGADMTLSDSATLADAKPRRPARPPFPICLMFLPLPKAVLPLVVLPPVAARAVRAKPAALLMEPALLAANSNCSPCL